MYSNESYLIELLTQAGYLNEEILQYARSQKSPTQDLVDFLIQANYLTEDVIAQVAASTSLLPVVDLGSMHIPQEVRELINAYGAIGEEGLWKNLEKFLKKVIPVAEECGVVMAIHPDDPPYPIFGLPRIITCEENLDRFLALVDSPANSLCLCTGSLGCAKSNDVAKMVRKYSAMGRIGFMHIRNVKIMDDGSFEERAHLSSCGSLDIYEIVKALVETGFDGYVRPDHGRMIWGETGKPGYGLFDRALGATYINGLFEACEKDRK